MIDNEKKYLLMNLSKTFSLIAIALGSTLPLSANEYKFEDK